MVVPVSVRPVPSCAECGLESAGRCPTCRRNLCMDHFSRTEHQPCAVRLAARADEYVCYVCGAPARPQQWSTAIFAHYVDSAMCHGCGRYVCDAHHTALQEEQVEIVRDGLRSHRYHVTQRYCSLCAPLRHVKGIVGLTRLASLVAVVAATVYFAVQALRVL